MTSRRTVSPGVPCGLLQAEQAVNLHGTSRRWSGQSDRRVVQYLEQCRATNAAAAKNRDVEGADGTDIFHATV